MTAKLKLELPESAAQDFARLAGPESAATEGPDSRKLMEPASMFATQRGEHRAGRPHFLVAAVREAENLVAKW